MECADLRARFEVEKPELIQLYSSANSPNGMKVSAMLEEIFELKNKHCEGSFDFEAHSVDVRHNETRRWKALFPTGKLPVILDPAHLDAEGQPLQVFESGAILLYLADKYKVLMPCVEDEQGLYWKTQTTSWLFWGCTTLTAACKNFGFYYKYCHHNLPYCRTRYATEVLRLAGVLEQQLRHEKHWICGDMYTVADIAVWPCFHALTELYGDAMKFVFNDFKDYPRLKTWFERCMARNASKKCLVVCPELA